MRVVVLDDRNPFHPARFSDKAAFGCAVQTFETVACCRANSGRYRNSTDAGSNGTPRRLPGTRELVVSGTPYIVPYRVRRERLELLAVFDGRRQWPGRL